uniref:Ankyrin repeat and zinc finger peptidyl tRNA hydrolase 1 n=1 Tax=Salvator merianae TaxID=96440 RepID=A0A8D0C1C7_SALMN
MAGGGHFAGAVFKGNEVLEHKTFHRYTVRARRGTSQGTRDAKGSKPKSAGASLRRYNEAALLKDIQELLNSWAKHLQEAERIFLRAPRTSRARFFGNKGLLQQDDSRIRGIPFSTRRATFHEVQRVHGALSSLQVYGEDANLSECCNVELCSLFLILSVVKPKEEEEEEEEEEETVPQLELVELTLNTLDLREFEVQPKCGQKKRRRRKPKGRQLEHLGLGLPAWRALGTSVQDVMFTACKMGDVSALQHLLGVPADAGHDDNGLSPQQLLNTPLDESGWTLLHVAAAAGRSEVVRLLLEAGADPAVRDRQEQPPYCVSANKQTRNEFRRFMSEQPQKYNYTQAQVPGPLTTEMEARQAERRRAHKAQRKQREKEEREAQQLRAQEEDEKRRFAALSDREKCALAAERRLVSQLKDSSTILNNTRRCWLCGESLLGRIPFHYLEFSFCSTNCLRTHRQRKTTTS